LQEVLGFIVEGYQTEAEELTKSLRVPGMAKKKSVRDFQIMKGEGGKIVGLTAYDYHMAHVEELAGVDLIEVGDSLGICVYGYSGGTTPVTMDQCIAHTEAVRRGAPHTFVIGDMPFLSYQASPEDAVRNAGRFYKEAGVDAVMIEGGRRSVEVIKAIVSAGMVVCGDLGLPETGEGGQESGSYRCEGRTAESAYELMKEARAVQEAGASLLILGPVPSEVGRFIAWDLSIPVIGVGAGPDCDGQIVIVNDVLGICEALIPKFVKRYASIAEEALKAIRDYASEIQHMKFPTEDHYYCMEKGEEEKLLNLIGKEEAR
jgi:3-methyl-2-oxobutanoate hydroxymethyltransferase